MAKLDRRAALSIVRAPSGYGKSAFLASWLRTSRATDRIVVWVDAPDPGTGLAGYFTLVLGRLHDAGVTLSATGRGIDEDPFAAVAAALGNAPAPVLLILIRPDLIEEPNLSDHVVDLLARRPGLDVVVTLSGLGMFPEPYLLDVEHEIINAGELLFTTTETAQLLELSEAPTLPGEADHIVSLTGGIPALIRAAVAALKNLPPGSNRTQILERHLTRAIDQYATDHVLGAADQWGQREFVLATAYASALTAELASRLSASGEALEQVRARLILLEVSGILSRADTEPEDTWEFPAAIRDSILRLRSSAGIDVSQRLSFLAHDSLDQQRPASALDYAVEAGNWTLAVDIVEQHWVAMIVDDLDVVRSALHRIPPAAADKHPAVQAGRALFGVDPTTGITSSSLPESASELSALAATPEAKDALSIGCVHSIMLRLTGDYERSAAITRKVSHLARSALEHNPDAVSGQLPLMRVQWAVNYQLHGAFTESTIEARLAYHGGLMQKIDFITRNGAGTIALNWAMLGEPLHALRWSGRERQYADPNGWLEPLVRIAGLVARTVSALDTLDDDEARATLSDLGYPSETEELWAFVVYAHSQYALGQGDAFAALSLLRRTVAVHHHQHTSTAFSVPLMQATEIDLLLSLGHANEATALAGEIDDPAANPWTVVSVARLHQRVGRNEAAVSLCHQFDWTAGSCPRAQLESLLVQAVAHAEMGEPDRAAQAWSRACSIADQTGLLRSFATIATADIEMLEALAVTGSATVAKFRKNPPPEAFPKTVPLVELTEREQIVLALLDAGMAPAAMANTLYVSVNTVKSQLRTLYRKLGAHNRDEAITRAHSLKLVPRDTSVPAESSLSQKESRIQMLDHTGSSETYSLSSIQGMR